MQQYESVIILTPLLSEEVVKEIINKFHGLMKEGGAEIIHKDDWGLRKLAYPIQKKSNGYYYLTEFKAPSEFIAKLEIEYKREERIMRFLTLALDKDAIAYNEKKRSGAFNKKPAQVEEAKK